MPPDPQDVVNNVILFDEGKREVFRSSLNYKKLVRRLKANFQVEQLRILCFHAECHVLVIWQLMFKSPLPFNFTFQVQGRAHTLSVEERTLLGAGCPVRALQAQ